MKLGIVVGHSIKDGGAVLNLPENILRQYNFEKEYAQEYDYNRDIARGLEATGVIYGVDVKIFFRDGLSISGAHEEAENWGASVILELHFNSVADTEVAGSEVLTTPEYEKLNGFAAEMSGRMASLFGGSNRGVKHPDTRGHGNVYRPIPTYLLEPFFGSNPEQAEHGLKNMEAYVKLILILANKYFD